MMQFVTLLAGAVPAFAAAISPGTPPGDGITNPTTGLPLDYTWLIQNWHSGCDGRQGCDFGFNFTAEAEGIYPGVVAGCGGLDTGYYSPCVIFETTTTNNTPFVQASLRPNFHNGVASMSVSLSFGNAEGVTLNVSAWGDTIYNKYQLPYANFTVTPAQLTQVS